MEKIIQLLKKQWTYLLGIMVGGLGGYLYWFYVGCTTGSCPLKSSPLMMIIWGGLVGALIFNIFKRKQ